MAIEAARSALARAGMSAEQLSAVWVGSESHPYSVKPSGTIVAEALGATPWVSAADWEFACKAGSEALTAGMGMVGSGMAEYVLAIGADTAQGRPGDALEYTAAAGAAALLVGPAERARWRRSRRPARMSTIRPTSSAAPTAPIRFMATVSPASRPTSSRSAARRRICWISSARSQPTTPMRCFTSRTRASHRRSPNSLASRRSRSRRACSRRRSATPTRRRRCWACARCSM